MELTRKRGKLCGSLTPGSVEALTPMCSLLLLAEAPARGGDPLQSPEVIWGVAGLTVALLVGAAVIYAVDKWRKRAALGPTEVDATDALTTYREMHRNGEITDEEYAKLRDKVAAKVKTAPLKPPAADSTRPATPPFLPPAFGGDATTDYRPPPPDSPPSAGSA